MQLRRFRELNPVLGYVMSAAIGTSIFCGYWWILGRVVTVSAETPQKNGTTASPTPAPNQSTSGSQSPIISGGSGITINYNNSNPKLKAKLDEIARLLKQQHPAETVTPPKLLEKYPLGYVIFDVNYRNEAFPYRDEATQRYTFDWTAVKYEVYSEDQIAITLPTIRTKGGAAIFEGNSQIVPKKVGPLRAGFFGSPDVQIMGEILAITDKGIVFLMGMQKPKP